MGRVRLICLGAEPVASGRVSLRVSAQARDKYLPEYDEDASTMMILFTWYGTMFPLVLRKPLFWMMLSLHLSLARLSSAPPP